MRRALPPVLLVIAALAFASVASAHILTFKLAHRAAEAEAREYCNSFSSCTHFGARSCQRFTAHRIRCIGIVRDRSGGHCTWPVDVRMKRGSFRLLISSNPQQTQTCRQ
jgi:hypothetical protein